MSISTLTSAALTIPYMPMTVPILDCPPPILEADFENCRIPGGLALWSANGFYSPGQCFQGYQAECTQSVIRDDEWPIDEGETAVRCIPAGFNCNEENGNPKYATTEYDGTTLSAPAFEIRWRSDDLKTGEDEVPWPTVSTSTAASPTTMASEGVSITPVATTPSQPSNSFPPAPTESQSSSLNTGSIAGIAIGASFGTILTALLIIFIAMRRHRQKSTASTSDSNNYLTQHHQPSYATSPNQPPVELHPESMGPRELESEPVSPESNKTFPVSPTSPMDRNVMSLNRVPVEMAGDETFTRRSTGVVGMEERMSGTTREGSGEEGGQERRG